MIIQSFTIYRNDKTTGYVHYIFTDYTDDGLGSLSRIGEFRDGVTLTGRCLDTWWQIENYTLLCGMHSVQVSRRIVLVNLSFRHAHSERKRSQTFVLSPAITCNYTAIMNKTAFMYTSTYLNKEPLNNGWIIHKQLAQCQCQAWP